VPPPFFRFSTRHTDATFPALTECERDSTCDKFLIEARDSNSATKGQSIRALLITPVQRVPRYNMLLEDLLKNTPRAHAERSQLEEAVELMKSIANGINEAIRRGENMQKILVISTRFVGTAVGTRSRVERKVDLVAPHRELVRDGPMSKLCRKSAKPRWFFLFNDILLYATIVAAGDDSLPRFTMPMQFDIHTVHLEDVPDMTEGGGEKIENAFEIRTPKKSFVVQCEDTEEKVSWVMLVFYSALF
jgi:RhoGEF domain/PH domain